MSDNTSTLAPSASAPAVPEPGSLVARLAGVIFSPGATFAKLVPKAPWLGALAVVTLLTAGGQYAFLSTEVGQEAMVDQQSSPGRAQKRRQHHAAARSTCSRA